MMMFPKVTKTFDGCSKMDIFYVTILRNKCCFKSFKRVYIFRTAGKFWDCPRSWRQRSGTFLNAVLFWEQSKSSWKLDTSVWCRCLGIKFPCPLKADQTSLLALTSHNPSVNQIWGVHIRTGCSVRPNVFKKHFQTKKQFDPERFKWPKEKPNNHGEFGWKTVAKVWRMQLYPPRSDFSVASFSFVRYEKPFFLNLCS